MLHAMPAIHAGISSVAAATLLVAAATFVIKVVIHDIGEPARICT